MGFSINDADDEGNTAKVSAGGALLTALGPDYLGSDGGKHCAELSTNLATVISAGTAAGAGHIGQFRWSSATRTCLIDRMVPTFTQVTDATTLQRISIEIRKMTGLTATATGGVSNDATNFMNTVLALDDDSTKLRDDYPDTALTDFRMTDTADLTAGAGARNYLKSPICSLNCAVPSVGATTDPIRHSIEWNANGSPIVLTGAGAGTGTGLVLLNRILWGTALTAVVSWRIEWREILNADLPAL
jgi:hypothetical protein